MIYCKTHVMYHLCKNDLWSQIYAPLRTRQHTMAANEGVTKAIASLFRDDSDTVFPSIYVPIIYSEGINFDWHNGWKRWTLGQKNIRVEESNTRLEKWRSTWNANTIAKLIKIKVLLHQFWNLIITYIICTFKTKFRVKNIQIII